MNQFNLNNTQKTLFISAMVAIIAQLFSIYCFLDETRTFNILYCLSYLFFSALAYVCYYKLVIP